MDKFKSDILFKDLTTLEIGGPIKLYVEAFSETDLIDSLKYAQKNSLPFLVIGGGSNLLVSDQGFDGLVIKNNLTFIKEDSTDLVVGTGTVLQELVNYTTSHGLAGAQKLTGIPGTVGGGLFGNAGAYGQTISDHVKKVVCFDPKRQKKVILEKSDCQFSYRDSGFKKNGLIILEVIFDFLKADSQKLTEESQEVLQKRTQKYRPGIKCPGSFFKNVLMENLPEKTKQMIPAERDYYGKVPAWYFLDEVGARGDGLGQVKIADFHGNLFTNEGGGSAQDFYNLALKYFKKVKEKFNIELEPEVQLINLPPFK